MEPKLDGGQNWYTTGRIFCHMDKCPTDSWQLTYPTCWKGNSINASSQQTFKGGWPTWNLPACRVPFVGLAAGYF